MSVIIEMSKYITSKIISRNFYVKTNLLIPKNFIFQLYSSIVSGAGEHTHTHTHTHTHIHSWTKVTLRN